jgi:hypothetical protein
MCVRGDRRNIQPGPNWLRRSRPCIACRKLNRIYWCGCRERTWNIPPGPVRRCTCRVHRPGIPFARAVDWPCLLDRGCTRFQIHRCPDSMCCMQWRPHQKHIHHRMVYTPPAQSGCLPCRPGREYRLKRLVRLRKNRVRKVCRRSVRFGRWQCQPGREYR